MQRSRLPQLLCCALIAVLAGACSTAHDDDDDTMSRPPHHTDSGFRNNHDNAHHGMSLALLRFLWKLQTQPWEPVEMETAEPKLTARGDAANRIGATWLGHAGFLLQMGGLNILTDPVLTHRVSPVRFAGPARLQPPVLQTEELPPSDVVVISHDHYDHLDLPTLQKLRELHDPLLVVPLRVGEWLRGQGFERVVELDWWQHHDVNGVRIHAVPVQHFSGRGLRRNGTLWAGYVMQAGEQHVFFAGDTGYSADFRAIGERFAPIDLALIPIGAYAPREFMQPVHVNPEEAVKIHQDVGARRSIGMHWGTFRLTTEPLDEPPQRLRAAAREAGLEEAAFRTVALGETVFVEAGGENNE